MVGNSTERGEKNLAGDGPDRPAAGRMVESVVGCKWSMAVLAAIGGGAHRPAQIERACEGISDKVLHERLRKLERFGVVERRVFAAKPPHVEYHFTPLGLRFREVIEAVKELQAALDASED